MKVTLNTYEVAERILDDPYSAWSWNGAKALAEYLEELEGETGEVEMEFDACAVRGDFSEYESLMEWAEEFFKDYKDELDIKDEDDEDTINEKIEDFIYDQGIFIEFDGGVVVSNF